MRFILPEGWRLLTKDEIPQAGDAYYDGSTWFVVGCMSAKQITGVTWVRQESTKTTNDT